MDQWERGVQVYSKTQNIPLYSVVITR